MHVFMVRIWRERREIEGAPPEWRGAIEHVASGERRYVKQVDEIVAFISRYWNAGSLPSGCRPWLRRWMKKWRKK